MNFLLNGATKRKMRNRTKRAKTNRSNRLVLAVTRSNKNITAQIFTSKMDKVLVTASSNQLDIKAESTGKRGIEIASLVGAAVAQKLLTLGQKEVVFDRGPYLYHGRVKALADAARAAGLIF